MAEVTVYSKPNCVDCTATKKLLNSVGVEFTEVNVTEDPSVIASLKKEGFRKMPVVYADDQEPWSGFQEDRIRALVEDDEDIWA